MSSTNAAAYLSGKGMAWASGSLLAAAKARPGLRTPSRQSDVLGIFAPVSASAAFSSTSLYSPHSSRRKPASLSLTLRRVTRYHSTETQAQRSATASPPPLASSSSSSPSSSSASKGAAAASACGTSPSAPLISEKTVKAAQPVSPDTATELGSSSNQTTASQTALAEKQKEKAELEAQKPQQSKIKKVWAKVKEEALHYWHGSKLLAKEVRISSRLLRRLMLGYSLTRREHRQLKRTMADLLRLIPFIPFVVIPAGELLLPVAIKIFPNMLPSTFESKFAAEEKRRGLIKVRLEMAKFLQETIREGGLQATDKVQTSEEFKEFFRKVRSTGESPSDEDIIKVAKLFEDDLTLDNLSRPQLVSMCRYMQINAFGTDNYLRYQIRHKLTRIRQDDLVIASEGKSTMSVSELVSACQNRGIQTTDLSEDRLRQELGQWIELHLHQKISGILLILSKAFNYVAQGSNDSGRSHLKSLELTLSSLPDNLLNEAELNVNKEGATNKQRLEVLQQQEELIEDEAEQEEEEAAAREADKEKKNAEKARLAHEEQEARALLPEAETSKEAEDARMTNEQLMELGEALSIFSAKSSVLKEREELARLIEEVNSSEQPEPSTSAAAADGADATSTDASAGDEEGAATAAAEASSSTSSSSTRSMTKRIKSMLEKIDNQLEEYDRDVGSRMHIIEASPTGKISVDDLAQAFRLIKHKPDDEVLEKLVDKLDVDHDGLVPLDDVLELARAETGLGILHDETVKDITKKGQELRVDGKGAMSPKPKKSDIVEE